MKLNWENPLIVAHDRLFEMTLGKKYSSIPLLAHWPLPFFFHIFLHFLISPAPSLLTPSSLPLLCTLPLAQPRWGWSSWMVQAGVVEPPVPASSLWYWSVSSGSLMSWQLSWCWLLDNHYGKTNTQRSVDRSKRLEISWGRCCEA